MRQLKTRAGVLALAGAAGLALALTAAPAQAGSSTAQIDGSGSSWAANAVNQWIADVTQIGLQIVYTSNGSAQGRQDYANKTTDFAVSDIGYQGVDPSTGQQDTSLGRGYAYLPIVAGGTSFPYHISVNGTLIRNLRLSGLTVSKIFTNQITYWDNPEITADNNGRKLPHLPIIVVVHSEGSGSTAQFTKYMDTVYPSIWRPYAGASGLTEYYPRKGSQIAANGSDGVMNFIGSAAANGAIGYDEYSYPLAAGFPVAKIENTAGYFTAPDQYNVAVALTQALINMDTSSPDYLLQDLHKVYVYNDPRTYPLSSYSYMIMPTGVTCVNGAPTGCDTRMTTAKRQTLAEFLGYSICQGQAEMGKIGYSPLPINLVEASFAQTAKLKAADPGVDLTTENVANCHNPTFIAGHPTENYLAKVAPYPPSCDKSGAGPCTGSNAGITTTNPNGGKVATNGGTSGTTNTPTGVNASSSAGPGAAASVNPITGQSSQPAAQAGSDAQIAGSPTNLSADQSDNLTGLLAVLAALLLLTLVILPPVLYQQLSRRPGGGDKP
jgi:phosphate transport system substrate-binding protein